MIADSAALALNGIAEQIAAALTRAFESAVAALIAWLVSLVEVPL